MPETPLVEPTERRENFTTDAWRRLEEYIRSIRDVVGQLATDKADKDQPRGWIYNVTSAHIDAAVSELLPNIAEFKKKADEIKR